MFKSRKLLYFCAVTQYQGKKHFGEKFGENPTLCRHFTARDVFSYVIPYYDVNFKNVLNVSKNTDVIIISNKTPYVPL